MFKKAFSLSEVLLVVAIIGVVASLTVPNLIRDTEADRTVVQLRKFHNELNNAYQQVQLKYGDYETWGNITKAEKIQRYLEFLEVVRQGNNLRFPLATYNGTSYTKAELKDGLILSLINNSTYDSSDTESYYDVFVATNGLEGATPGEYIFGFTINPYSQRVEAFGKRFNNSRKAPDRSENGKLSLSSNIYGTNWAITNGNLDYLKCANVLNWNNRLSCK